MVKLVLSVEEVVVNYIDAIVIFLLTVDYKSLCLSILVWLTLSSTGYGFRLVIYSRLQIPLRGLSRYQGIGFWNPLKGLSGLWVTPGLVVPM